MRSAPGQIEADIMRYYPGRRVAEWWRTITYGTGEMSSRVLVVMIDELPDDSRYKRYRSAAWTTSELLLALNANIGHGLREDYRGNYGQDYDYTPVTAPPLAHETDRADADRTEGLSKSRAAHDLIAAMMRGEVRMEDIDPTAPIEEVA